ncbi:MAG: carbonic anhydrase family protein [Thiomicrorhabdus sp.]|nr:carbonic anhydrase family protein [Thiomicrorhabdus sp.]
MKKIALISVLALAISGVACTSNDVKDNKVSWGYTGATGPIHWGDLSSEFATCKTGKEQSPIDIRPTQDIAQSDVTFDYQTSSMSILNNGHTVQVNFDKGSSISFKGTKYNLLQVHFHTPSENLLMGESYPLEAHFVHASDDGQLAVVAVLINEGQESGFIQKVVDHMPSSKTAAKAVEGVSLSSLDFIPSQKGHFGFKGSLTTPPCSEGVQWLMMKAQTTASKAQIDALHAVMHDNNRPIQPLNGRTVSE